MRKIDFTKNAFTLAETLITLAIIGIVAAITIPTLVKSYQKTVTINRLKKAYSELYQVVNLSINDNGQIESWNFRTEADEFFNTYLKKYFKTIKTIEHEINIDGYPASNDIVLANGTTMAFSMYSITTLDNANLKPYMHIVVDINGTKKPNKYGKDRFSFFILSQKEKKFYNTGHGDCARNVPSGGLYPDGYGYNRELLLNGTSRGCNTQQGKVKESDSHENLAGAFCTALIMLDGWKISDDYSW